MSDNTALITNPEYVLWPRLDKMRFDIVTPPTDDTQDIFIAIRDGVEVRLTHDAILINNEPAVREDTLAQINPFNDNDLLHFLNTIDRIATRIAQSTPH